MSENNQPEQVSLPRMVMVRKEDIENIGHTMFNENGYLSIICDYTTCNIEEILLRTILQCWGDEYRITSSDDRPDGLVFDTNLSWDIYKGLL